MGLFSKVKDIVGKTLDPLGITGFGGGGGILGDITGANGADAAVDAARIQAGQFDKLIDLYRPITQAGIDQLPFLESSATVGGFGNTIGEILNSDAFSALRGQRQRTATQQFAQAGLRRSGYAGKAAADIDTDLALSIENELNRRRQAILGTGQTGMQATAGGLTGIGSSLAGGVLGAQQAQAQGSNNLLAIGGSLLAALSDRRLKSNVVKIGKIGKANVYRWDWNEIANDVGLEGSSTGLMADEIKQLHPDCVVTVNGLDMVLYDKALEELQNAA